MKQDAHREDHETSDLFLQLQTVATTSVSTKASRGNYLSYADL